jgi:hypothetical protein
MLLTRKFLFSLALLGAFTGAADAANRYVRAGANGNGSDWNNAYGNLPSTLVRGDTYYLADGAYGSHTFNDANSGTTVITIKKATQADHGTDAGWSSAYGDGQAIFENGWNILKDYYVFNGARRNSDWRSGAVSQYGIRVANTRLDDGSGVNTSDHGGDNLEFRYIDFHGQGRDNGSGDDVIYGLSGNSNLTFQYCALHDSGRTIFLMRGNWRNLTVDHSYMARNTSTPAVHGELLSMTESDGVTWSNNVMEDIEGSAFLAGVNPGSVSNWKIFGNVFTHSAAYAANTGRTSKDHNFGVSGIIYMGQDTPAKNLLFYNNTIHNIQGLWSGMVITTGAGGNVSQNNIWYNSVRTNNSFSGTMANNWYFKTQADGDDSSTKVVCTTGCDVFVDAANKNFDLKVPVPQGLALSSPYNIDPDGSVRGADGVWDRGAFEYSAGSPPTTTTPTTTSSTVPSTTSTTARATTTTTTTSTTLSVPPSGSGQSVFSTQVPQTLANSDGAGVNYELGLRFTPTAAGQIRSIRFYKSSSESGSHTGKIYAANGQLLASVVFANESGSGWQVQNLATPLNVIANTEYTVSVNTGNTYYVATNNGLSSGITSGSLQSPAGGGVYGPVGSKPNLTWQYSNYFRDVVFVPNPTGQSLFTTQTPQLLSNTDGPNANYELGMRFTTTTAGQIKAIRFYKSSSESGVHSGKIYAASGQLLALVNFTSETGSGWQVQNLPAPLNIAANTEYTVTVNTGNSYYVATNNGLATQITNGSLRSVGGGVFGPVGAKPTQSWQSSNYFRDVVFSPF